MLRAKKNMRQIFRKCLNFVTVAAKLCSASGQQMWSRAHQLMASMSPLAWGLSHLSPRYGYPFFGKFLAKQPPPSSPRLRRAASSRFIDLD
ncbi:hypothetical protein Y032_0007g3203 [Ancylostoma ceylanicum]|uniref:Uncharacterized protein n=1 Tax=Ancylostoma ceylanicum TaxID=53326 RepID=A0A016VLU0_9BILA|nr:hypothetical protein Y032_0007g3203 [Ancylostoma ceylanicum]